MANIINSVISGGVGGSYPLPKPYGKAFSDFSEEIPLSDLFSTFPTSSSTTQVRNKISKANFIPDWDTSKYMMVTQAESFVQLVYQTGYTRNTSIATPLAFYSNRFGYLCEYSRMSLSGSFGNINSFLNDQTKYVATDENMTSPFSYTPVYCIYYNSINVKSIGLGSYGIFIGQSYSTTKMTKNGDGTYRYVWDKPPIQVCCNNNYCNPNVVPYVDLNNTYLIDNLSWNLYKIDDIMLSPYYGQLLFDKLQQYYDQSKDIQ